MKFCFFLRQLDREKIRVLKTMDSACGRTGELPVGMFKGAFAGMQQYYQIIGSVRRHLRGALFFLTKYCLVGAEKLHLNSPCPGGFKK